jgi:hypothetical protein
MATHTSTAAHAAHAAATAQLTSSSQAALEACSLPPVPRTTMPAKLMAGADVRNGLRAKLQHNASRQAPESDSLLEAWVNNVLATSYAPGTQPSSLPPGSSRATEKWKLGSCRPPPGAAGLAKYGLTHEELARGGLSEPDVRRLYKGLYVYSMGLFDLLQVRAAG